MHNLKVPDPLSSGLIDRNTNKLGSGLRSKSGRRAANVEETPQFSSPDYNLQLNANSPGPRVRLGSKRIDDSFEESINKEPTSENASRQSSSRKRFSFVDDSIILNKHLHTLKDLATEIGSEMIGQNCDPIKQAFKNNNVVYI